MKSLQLLVAFSWIINAAIPSALAQCLSGNCVAGQGTFMYPDSAVYVGGFVNAKAEGYGVRYFANKDRYVGEWKNDQPHGKGTWYAAKGNITEGVWTNGTLTEDLTAKKSTFHKTIAPPKVWAVVVGVSAYPNLQHLNYADDDAQRMYGFLTSTEGGAVAADQITLLTDQQATKQRILETVADVFGKAKEEDIVLFYFSGHGLPKAFLPIDYDQATQTNGIVHDEISTLLQNAKAKHKICILDACHAGGLAGRGLETTLNNAYHAFENSNGGTVFIVSSKEEEASIEDKGLRQGIFTHFLIKALRGMADYNQDQVVTVKEAFQYVQSNVMAYTNNYQTPMLMGEFDDNMPLHVVR